MKKKIIFYIGAVCSLFGCDYNDGRLQVKNSGYIDIAVEFSKDTVPIGNNLVEYFISQAIAPGKTERFLMPGNNIAWSNYIQISKNKKLNVFVYDLDTLKKYQNMDSIRHKKLYIKRIKISEEELNQKNWIVTYP
jgi:hypothetical protein